MKKSWLFLLIWIGINGGVSAQKNKADSLEKLLPQTMTDTVRIRILNQLAFALYPIDPEKSKSYAQNALDLSEKINFPKGQGEAYVNFGIYFRQKSEFEQSLENLKKALVILEPLDEIEAVGNAYITLGLINAQQANFAQAHTYHLKALKLYEKANNQEKVGVCLANIGSTYLFQEEYNSALQYHFKSLKVSQSVQDKWRETMSYGNIAAAYSKKGEYDTALVYFEKYLIWAKQVKQPSGRSLIVMGETYAAKKEYEKALKTLQKAFEELEKAKNLYYVAEVCNVLGKVYWQTNQLDSALFFYQKGLEYAEGVGAKALVSKSYEGISRVYKSKSQIDSAYKYLDLFLTLKEAVYREDISRKMNFAQFSYDLEKKQAEITILQEQNSKEVIMRNLIGVVVIILLLGGIVLYKNKEKIKNANNLLYMKNIEVTEKTQEILVQNEELRQQKEEILAQRDDISIKNQELVLQKEQIEEAKRSIEVVSEIGQQITAYLDLEKVINVLYQYLNEIMAVDEVRVGTYNPRTRMISFDYYIYQGKILPAFQSSVDEPRFSSWVVKNQKLIVLGNVKQEYHAYLEDLDGYSPEHILNSMICVPLMIGDKILGVLRVQSAKEYAYEENDVDILQALASYISISIENIQAYKIIEEKNKNITDSIRYAQNIQHAILPPEEELKEIFKEYFVIFQPKDIVSGDFYWLTTVNSGEWQVVSEQLPSLTTNHLPLTTILAVVDCTGHGVPGAFMSMIGNILLHEIINVENIIETDEILTQLDQKIRVALQQDNGKNQDGMDLALCSFKLEEEGYKISFSGAKNSIIYVKNGEMQKVKGDSKGIGGIHKEKILHFTKHQFFLPKGSCLYLYSDGYIDQSDPAGNRIGSGQLEAWIREINQKDMPTQKNFFTENLRTHQKDASQRDDITFLGLRL